jgi:uncharacterized protein YndB with AHSA1/START domain
MMRMTAMEKLQVATPNDTDIVVSRSFAAPRELVFDCHTKPELVRRWLLGPEGWTMPVCEIDLRPGGKFRYVWSKPGEPDLHMSGEFREIDRPNRIVHVERFDEDWAGGEQSEVTTVFEEKAGRTTMTMTIRFSSKEVREAAMATGMTDGMNASYDRLETTILAGK